MSEEDKNRRIGAARESLRESGRTHVTVEFLIRRLDLPRSDAAALLKELQDAGLVGHEREAAGYRVLIGATTKTPIEKESTTATCGVDAANPPRTAEDVSQPVAMAAEMTIREMAIADIKIVPGVQLRQALDEDRVDQYAELMAEGHELPAVVLFNDGHDLFLADGHHRVAAGKKSGRKRMKAYVRQGSVRDAILYALRANSAHGLPLSREEKRDAALRLLRDPDWGNWSDREIARRVGLTGPTIAKLRAEISDCKNFAVDDQQRTCSVNGRKRKVKTSKIGRKPGPPKNKAPNASKPGQPPKGTATSESFASEIDALRRHVEMVLTLPGKEAAFATLEARLGEGLRQALSRLMSLLPVKGDDEGESRAAA